MFDGWLKADPAARGEDVELPLAKGEELDVKDVSSMLRRSRPPPQRYTEAGLIKELEKRGIGRPSTYASIMKTLGDRGYVTKEGRTLIPPTPATWSRHFLKTTSPPTSATPSPPRWRTSSTT
jgi:DNA topoisomerase-1